VRLFEQTAVHEIAAGRVDTDAGRVRADIVVRAAEGYTGSLQGHGRTLAPIYSLMVATEPLPTTVWSQLGVAARETFNDARHLLIYAQRTADDRLALGGRGAPYHFGSKVQPGFDRVPRVFAALQATVRELFPTLADVGFTHRWGGVLGVPRDWHASVGLDRVSGLAWAGGYVGDGVGSSQLAGRTLADLITGRDSDLVRLPWVGHHSRRWEPEPLRWLQINAGLRAMSAADAEERLTGRPSLLAHALSPVLGGH
jgi:glycine/D-amino acid oxidase-like deaminating enzyme